MFTSKELLIVIFILGSAIVLKATAFYSAVLANPSYVMNIADPMGTP